MKASRRRVLMTLIIWLAYIWPVSAGEVELPEELQNLYARSAVVMDGSSGRVLFGKNTEEVMPMASTTKIMTCILALEACTPDTVVTVSESAGSTSWSFCWRKILSGGSPLCSDAGIL